MCAPFLTVPGLTDPRDGQPSSQVNSIATTCRSQPSAGYTFFWIEPSQNERREAGFGFAFKSNLVNKLAVCPKGINDHLMTVRPPLQKKSFATLISAYAPTMTNPDEMKDRFSEDLKDTIATVPGSDKLIIFGDFNA